MTILSTIFDNPASSMSPFILPSALTICSFLLLYLLKAKLVKSSSLQFNIVHSYPFFFPYYDLLLLLLKYQTNFRAYVSDRRKALGSYNFFAKIPLDPENPLNVKPLLIITHPDDQAKVMSKERQLGIRLVMAPTTVAMHGPGNLQVMVTGERHQFMRKIFGSLLSPRALESFVPHIISHFTTMWKSVQQHNDDDDDEEEVVVSDVIRDAQLRVMCRIFFGLTFENDDEGFEKLRDDFELEEKALFAKPSSRTFQDGLEASKRNRALLEGLFDKALEARRGIAEKNTTDSVGSAMEVIADAILDAGMDNDSQTISDTKDNLLLLLEASHQTTMHTTTSLIYYINHPNNKHALEKIREEVLSIGEPNYENLKGNMPYCDSSIKETQRLAPIIGSILYTLPEGKKLQLHDRVLKGPINFMNSFSVNYQDESFFSNPQSFMPQRWLEGKDQVNDLAKRSFHPFGLGRHLCLGYQLALLVMKASLFCFVKENCSVEFDAKKVKVVNNFFPERKVNDGLPAKVVKA